MKKQKLTGSNRGSHCGTSVIKASQERRKKQRKVPRTIRILAPVSQHKSNYKALTKGYRKINVTTSKKKKKKLKEGITRKKSVNDDKKKIYRKEK